MRASGWRLRISVVEETEERRERALPVIDALAGIRPVIGDGPWLVTYAAGDVTEAFARCVEDLDSIDPRWVEVLDFAVIPEPSKVGARAHWPR